MHTQACLWAHYHLNMHAINHALQCNTLIPVSPPFDNNNSGTSNFIVIRSFGDMRSKYFSLIECNYAVDPTLQIKRAHLNIVSWWDNSFLVFSEVWRLKRQRSIHISAILCLKALAAAPSFGGENRSAKYTWHGVWMRINTGELVNGHPSSAVKVQRHCLRLMPLSRAKEK